MSPYPLLVQFCGWMIENLLIVFMKPKVSFIHIPLLVSCIFLHFPFFKSFCRAIVLHLIQYLFIINHVWPHWAIALWGETLFSVIDWRLCIQTWINYFSKVRTWSQHMSTWINGGPDRDLHLLYHAFKWLFLLLRMATTSSPLSFSSSSLCLSTLILTFSFLWTWTALSEWIELFLRLLPSGEPSSMGWRAHPASWWVRRTYFINECWTWVLGTSKKNHNKTNNFQPSRLALKVCWWSGCMAMNPTVMSTPIIPQWGNLSSCFQLFWLGFMCCFSILSLPSPSALILPHPIASEF